MNSYSITQIKYVQAKELYQWMVSGASRFQVVDVRDYDYVGGHIKGSWNYKYNTLDEQKVMELKERLRNVYGYSNEPINVVFHCTLSQQRGPSSAMKFMRALQENELSRFQIYILNEGFQNWQFEYGDDPKVTENYDKKLWRFGY